jgi:hypothetical protein
LSSYRGRICNQHRWSTWTTRSCSRKELGLCADERSEAGSWSWNLGIRGQTGQRLGHGFTSSFAISDPNANDGTSVGKEPGSSRTRRTTTSMSRAVRDITTAGVQRSGDIPQHWGITAFYSLRSYEGSGATRLGGFLSGRTLASARVRGAPPFRPRRDLSPAPQPAEVVALDRRSDAELARRQAAERS